MLAQLLLAGGFDTAIESDPVDSGQLVTLEDAKIQLRSDGEEQDHEIHGFIADAVAWVENYTGHILTPRDVTEQFNGFGCVALRAWPVQRSAAVGVAYIGADGVPIAITGARLDASKRPARVLPPRGPFYPFRDTQQLFTVTVRAGWETSDQIPRDFRRAILILISAYDADREGGDIFQKAEAAARRLCGSYRMRRL
jgi:uncharacterized phiE125 gp8 family phage protein